MQKGRRATLMTAQLVAQVRMVSTDVALRRSAQLPGQWAGRIRRAAFPMAGADSAQSQEYAA